MRRRVVYFGGCVLTGVLVLAACNRQSPGPDQESSAGKASNSIATAPTGEGAVSDGKVSPKKIIEDTIVDPSTPGGRRKIVRIQVESSAFKDGKPIPKKYTCEGQDVSPPLKWSGVPLDAKMLVLSVVDTDAPKSGFTHWFIWNLPPTRRQLAEAVELKATLPGGLRQNKNDFGKIGYRGPCPPAGMHRYVFTLFALSKSVDLSNVPNAKAVKTIVPFIVGQGQITGTYTHSR